MPRFLDSAERNDKNLEMLFSIFPLTFHLSQAVCGDVRTKLWPLSAELGNYFLCFWEFLNRKLVENSCCSAHVLLLFNIALKQHRHRSVKTGLKFNQSHCGYNLLKNLSRWHWRSCPFTGKLLSKVCYANSCLTFPGVTSQFVLVQKVLSFILIHLLPSQLRPN